MGSGLGLYKLRKRVEHSCLFLSALTMVWPAASHPCWAVCGPHCDGAWANRTLLSYALVRVLVLAMKRVVNTCVLTCKAHLKHLYKTTVNPQLPTDVGGALMIDLLEIKVSFLVACFPTIRIVLSALVSILFEISKLCHYLLSCFWHARAPLGEFPSCDSYTVLPCHWCKGRHVFLVPKGR